MKIRMEDAACCKLSRHLDHLIEPRTSLGHRQGSRHQKGQIGQPHPAATANIDDLGNGKTEIAGHGEHPGLMLGRQGSKSVAESMFGAWESHHLQIDRAQILEHSPTDRTHRPLQNRVDADREPAPPAQAIRPPPVELALVSERDGQG